MAGRVIFHIDLNAFFASAEMIKNPTLKNKPVAVSTMHRRSVVTTANYIARGYGVHSAMPVLMALEKCPELVVVEGHYDWYEELSKKFFNYLRRYTCCIEPASIDECYMDVTDIIKNYKRPLDLAWIIQKNVLDDLKLPCSIGVAPNKFLAKMASDMRKPLGITILRKQEIANKLWPLPLEEMWGIGKKTVPTLKKLGITTIGDMADEKNESTILQLLGKRGYSAVMHARGCDTNKLSYNTSIQSISQSTTLDKDITDYNEVKNVFYRLAAKLSQRAKEDHLKGSLISISIRYQDFRTIVRSQSLQTFTNDLEVLLETALLLFDRNYNDGEIRHLGIGLGSLYSPDKNMIQMDMFQQQSENTNDIKSVIASLNKQIPGANFITASQLKNKK